MNQATLIPTTAETEPAVKDKLIFNYLPGYARFLKDNHLEAYVKELLAGCWELDLPLMKVLKDMPHEQLLALSMQSHGDLLETIATNKLRGMLEDSLKKWETDKMDIITREDIATKDITLGTFVRKRAMLKFLPLYTTDPFEIIDIVKEIDIYDAESVTGSVEVYINILSDRISKQEAQLLEAQELTSLGSFEWNFSSKKLDASPQLLKILELEKTGDMQAFIEKVHHDDREKVLSAMKNAMNVGGNYECEYRLQCKDNKEKIIWSKGIVIFKDDKPYRFRGTVMDVTEKQTLIGKLQDSERLYQQAQSMSQIGNWAVDINTWEISWSDELYRIYELAIGSELKRDTLDLFTHPNDREKMAKRRERIFSTFEPDETIYRIVVNGQTKILLTSSELLSKDGKPYKLVGTVQDITERQTLLEELQQSDKLFKQAQAQTNIGNWTWDVTANKVSWSDEMYRIYGMEPQSVPVSFETYISHVHEDYREKRLAQVQHVFETGEPEDHIYKITAKDGKEKILHSKSEVQTDSEGKVISMTGTCQDVTERQLLIEKLQYSESLYKQAQAMSQMGSWTWDLKTDEMIWTDEMYSIYELDKETANITRKLSTSFQHPDDREMIQEHLEKLLATQVTEKFNYRIITAKGNLKILQAIKELIMDDEGSPVRVVGTVQDVTEQKAAEKNLNDSREFIQKIADTTPSIITSYNVNTGQYSYINNGLRRLLGYEPERGQKEGITFFAGIVHPDDLERITLQNAEALALANSPENQGRNIIAEFKYRMQHANGEYRWFHTFGTIFDRNEQGMVENVLNVSIDITAQEEAERILYQKNIELQQSNSSLEEYAYVASHDLKEPLRKICTFGDRLSTSQAEHLDEEGKLYLQKIIDSSQRMQTMISDLLSISLVSGNKNYETISLAQVMEDTLLLMEHSIEAKKAKIETSALPEASVVPSQFRQLFQNLINNSLKFTPGGTKPHIIIEHHYLEPKDVREYDLIKAKKYLAITVKDNGIGFENEFANKIFTIFQRLHGRDEYEGTGIGLAICKKVVENHGGVIFANGKLNEGSTFTIILPAK